MNVLKLNLGEKVKHIIDQYHLAADAHAELHRQAYQKYLEKNATGVYTPLHLWEILAADKDSADKQLAEYGAKLNAELVKLIKGAAADAEKGLTVTNSSADYASRVSMALSFLSAEGSDIDDAICFDLFSEFIHDLRVMNRFHRIVERKIDDPTRLYSPNADCYTDLNTGRIVELKPTGFRKTFQYMCHANTALKAISELLRLTERTFTRDTKPSNEEIYLGTHPVVGGRVSANLPMLSMSELLDEDRIQRMANDIDLMLIAMEKAGDFEDA